MVKASDKDLKMPLSETTTRSLLFIARIKAIKPFLDDYPSPESETALRKLLQTLFGNYGAVFRRKNYREYIEVLDQIMTDPIYVHIKTDHVYINTDFSNWTDIQERLDKLETVVSEIKTIVRI
jgi:hypothetical protein